MSPKILIVEDDVQIQDVLRILLMKNGYETVSAYSGTEALLVCDRSVDLTLLDLMLPGKGGAEILEEIKAKSQAPVIVLSAISDVMSKVDLLSLGADDYVTKPFQNEELLARITARLRAAGQAALPAQADVLKFKDLEIHTDDYSVLCAGKNADLTAIEYALLELFVRNRNRTCTKSMIYDSIWNYDDGVDDNALNVHISKLRKKLKECNPDEEYIETVWGIGYRLKKS